MSRCTLVNPLCPDDLCILEYGHEGTEDHIHLLETMVDEDRVSSLMFMAPKRTSRKRLIEMGDRKQKELWPDEA